MNFNPHGCKFIKDCSLFLNILFAFFYSCYYLGMMWTSTKIYKSLEVNVLDFSTLLSNLS